MGIKDFIKNLGEKQREKKEMINEMSDQVRFQKLVEERQLSSNERELLRYRNEDREASIKEQLEYARKKRDNEIKFGHNPIDTKNIIKAEWNVLKNKNQFSNVPNVTTGHKSVLKNDRKLLKSNKKLLKSNNKLIKGGSMFKI